VNVRQRSTLTVVLASTAAVAGCEVVEGIFKAGVWVGVIIVVLVLLGLFALFSRFR
jgi:hypothetical protein